MSSPADEVERREDNFGSSLNCLIVSACAAICASSVLLVFDCSAAIACRYSMMDEVSRASVASISLTAKLSFGCDLAAWNLLASLVDGSETASSESDSDRGFFGIGFELGVEADDGVGLLDVLKATLLSELPIGVTGVEINVSSVGLSTWALTWAMVTLMPMLLTTPV